MEEYVCRLFEESEEWAGRTTTRMYDAESVVDAAMAFYRDEGEFPDSVVLREYSTEKIAPPKEPWQAQYERVNKLLTLYTASREKTAKAVIELFHATKAAKQAVNNVGKEREER